MRAARGGGGGGEKIKNGTARIGSSLFAVFMAVTFN